MKEEISKLPQPIKENKYCQLCDVKYDNYKYHIESQEHIEKIKDNSDLFIGIVQTLKRIRIFWQHPIDAKTKDTNSSLDEISIKSTQDRQESEIEKSKELLSTINHNDFIGNKHYMSNDTYNYSEHHMNKERRHKIKQLMKGKIAFLNINIISSTDIVPELSLSNVLNANSKFAFEIILSLFINHNIFII